MSESSYSCGCSGDKIGCNMCGKCNEHCACPPSIGHEGDMGSPGLGPLAVDE